MKCCFAKTSALQSVSASVLEAGAALRQKVPGKAAVAVFPPLCRFLSLTPQHDRPERGSEGEAS